MLALKHSHRPLHPSHPPRLEAHFTTQTCTRCDGLWDICMHFHSDVSHRQVICCLNVFYSFRFGLLPRQFHTRVLPYILTCARLTSVSLLSRYICRLCRSFVPLVLRGLRKTGLVVRTCLGFGDFSEGHCSVCSCSQL